MPRFIQWVTASVSTGFNLKSFERVTSSARPGSLPREEVSRYDGERRKRKKARAKRQAFENSVAISYPKLR